MKIDRITLDQMRMIVAIAEQGGFTKAADYLNQSQSNLSRTVAQVERHIGITIFERTTRQFSLTDEGSHFVSMARNILGSVKREANYFQDYVAGVHGVLRLATLPSLAATLLPSLVVRFREQFPEVKVELSDFTAQEVLSHAVEGTIDLAITAIDDDYLRGEQDRFDHYAIATEHFSCILPATHPLASLDEVSWELLRDEPFVSFGASSSVRRIVDRALNQRGIEPFQQVTARSVNSVAGMCAAGIGISAAPAFVVPLMNVQGVVFRPFTGIPVTRTIGVIQPVGKAPTKSVQAFVDLLQSLDASDLTLPDHVIWQARAGTRR